MEKHLAEKFKDEQLDLICDCAGSPAIYTNSPKYLRKGGKFLSIVGGQSQGIVPFVMYKMRPVILGGTPREFQLLALWPSGLFARQVVEWVNEGAIKEVPIDSEYSMEDAVKVCYWWWLSYIDQSWGWLTRFIRHMKSWRGSTPRGRLWLKLGLEEWALREERLRVSPRLRDAVDVASLSHVTSCTSSCLA